MRCEEVRAVLGDYVAGSLDEPLRSEVESHIAGCPRCSRALQALHTVESLATSAPLRPDPPEDLEERVLAVATADEAAAAARGAALGPEPPPDLERRALARAGVIDRTERPARVRIATALVPALAAAAAVMSFMYMEARSDLDSAREPGATSSASAIPLDQVIGAPPTGHSLQTIELTGAGDEADADLELVHFRHDNYRLELDLHAAELPEMSPTSYYEIWLIGDDGEVSGGSFRVLGPDDIVFNFNVGIDPAEYHRIMVTREPMTGDGAREGRPVMWGSLDPARVDRP